MTNKTFINLNKKKQQLEFINILQDMVNLYADKRNEINYIVSPEEQKKFNQIFYTINYIDSLDVSCSKKSESASKMTLEEFNELYVGKAIHCKTEELANEFLELADSLGYKWRSGQNLTSRNEWYVYADKTFYNISGKKHIVYGNIDEEELPIIEFKGENKMKLEPFEIIEKLLGEIKPVGATHIDTERFENLNNYEDLIKQLVFKYASLIENKDRYEHSVKIVGERALKFIKFLNNELGYYIIEIANEMTLKEFNKLYLGKAVHCKTEELANEFLKLADSFGYNWSSGHKSTSYNLWSTFNWNTYYRIDREKRVARGNINVANLPIVEFKGGK